MEKINIKDKLRQIDVDLDNLVLGDFDKIGMFTALRTREPNDPLYKTVGCSYRANYERGILIYSLIRRYNLNSFLEIGFGRGYSSMCAAKAFFDMGVNGKITTIDPELNQEFVQQLQHVFPQKWFENINFLKGTSQVALENRNTEKHDLVYIDGDHSYEGTKLDLSLTKELCNSLLLCDDYHLPTKDDPGIACAKAIDEFDYENLGYSKKELIISDRRIFFDDRRLTDDQIDYGQVLFTKKELDENNEDW